MRQPAGNSGPSAGSAKPGVGSEPVPADDGLPDDIGLPPGPGLCPKLPPTPATGRPQPRSQKPQQPSEDGYARAGLPDMGDSETAEAILETMQIDRDELHWQELVGNGITAEVFRGTWRQKEVAIKRLNFTTRRTSQLKQEVAFLRETGVIAKISHNNLVSFYGLAFDSPPYLLVTEFCHGGTCYDLLHETEDLDFELTMTQQLKMCQDVAQAMEYLHKFRPQIIHRDLKSLNLLLMAPVTSTADLPHVKVSDFGLAKMKDQDQDWGKMTVEAGTFHWMAPEVATGNYSEKADIYSFAMVLFEFICQEIPFEDLEPVDVLKSTSDGQRPDMEAVPPNTPKALVDLMEDCWRHRPEERPTFEYICRTLDEIVDRVLGPRKL